MLRLVLACVLVNSLLIAPQWVYTAGGETVAWIALVVGVAATAALPFTRFDFNPLNLKDLSTESVATFLDLASDPDTTPYAIDVLAEDVDAVATPTSLNRRGARLA